MSSAGLKIISAVYYHSKHVLSIIAQLNMSLLIKRVLRRGWMASNKIFITDEGHEKKREQRQGFQVEQSQQQAFRRHGTSPLTQEN
jgi:hypothetical protein